jgi:hypothetical protein
MSEVRLADISFLLAFYWHTSFIFNHSVVSNDTLRLKIDWKPLQPEDGAANWIWCHQSTVRHRFLIQVPMTLLVHLSPFTNYSIFSIAAARWRWQTGSDITSRQADIGSLSVFHRCISFISQRLRAIRDFSISKPDQKRFRPPFVVQTIIWYHHQIEWPRFYITVQCTFRL